MERATAAHRRDAETAPERERAAAPAGGPLGPAAVLALQRTAGNAAVTALLAREPVAEKNAAPTPARGAPGDARERRRGGRDRDDGGAVEGRRRDRARLEGAARPRGQGVQRQGDGARGQRHEGRHAAAEDQLDGRRGLELGPRPDGDHRAGRDRRAEDGALQVRVDALVLHRRLRRRRDGGGRAAARRLGRAEAQLDGHRGHEREGRVRARHRDDGRQDADRAARRPHRRAAGPAQRQGLRARPGDAHGRAAQLGRGRVPQGREALRAQGQGTTRPRATSSSSSTSTASTRSRSPARS